jgi:hypothetical protein
LSSFTATGTPASVRRAVQCLDSPQAELDQLARVHLAGTHELGERGGTGEGEVLIGAA